MRHKNRRWLFIWAVMFSIMGILECECVKENSSANLSRQSSENSTKLTFSPRMDYEQWTPIGRGDPLKNDPTYDYVPPILEHVHYWVDPASRKPDPQLALDNSKETPSASNESKNPNLNQNQKTEILVLGVSSKKPSIPSPPSPATSADSRRDVYDPYLKYIENSPTKFQSNHYQRERIYYPYSHYFPSSPLQHYYKSNKHDRYKSSSHQLLATERQQIPYTILMPPPLPKPEGSIPHRGTTESGVTIQPGNLIYHSSTLSEHHLQSIREDQENYHTADSTSVTWRTPLAAPHQIKIPQDYKATTARPVGNDQVYKMGKVENAHMDAMNTYVNIGKPEAHIQSEIPITLSIPMPISISSISQPIPNPQIHNNLKPQPNHLLALLKKEVKQQETKEKEMKDQKVKNQSSQEQEPLLNPNIPSTMTSFLANIPKATTKAYTTTTTTPPSTTPINTLTTDPLFKHYKQPVEPLRGPMYLIIQGHSKVKTYGPAKQIFGINVQEMNEIPNYDNYKDFPVKHLHTYRRKDEYHPDRNNRGRSLDLHSLAEIAQTGYGAIEIEDIGQAHEEYEDIEGRQVKMEERIDDEDDGIIEGEDQDGEIKETELGTKFQVGLQSGNSDVYHKGIVIEEVTKGIEDNVTTIQDNNKTA